MTTARAFKSCTMRNGKMAFMACRLPLLLMVAAACSRHMMIEDRSPGDCPTPPKYRHIPPSPCSGVNVTVTVKVQRMVVPEVDMLRAQHIALRENGSFFIGWHATDAETAGALLGGGRYVPSERTGDDMLWKGLWVTSLVDRAVSYMQPPQSVLLRVYFKMDLNTETATGCYFVNNSDINSALMTSHFCNHSDPTPAQLLAGEGKYMIGGLVEPGGWQLSETEGYELIISQDFLPNVTFMYSWHNKDVQFRNGCAIRRKRNPTKERTNQRWTMTSVNEFIWTILIERRF